MAGFMADPINITTLVIEPEVLDIIAELDEFKGAWRALSNGAEALFAATYHQSTEALRDSFDLFSVPRCLGVPWE